MSLDKDVLLISKESFISELPTDLRDLKCLTYKKWYYKDLQIKIIKYFSDNYYYTENHYITYMYTYCF